jgi:hypothetical protein
LTNAASRSTSALRAQQDLGGEFDMPGQGRGGGVRVTVERRLQNATVLGRNVPLVRLVRGVRPAPVHLGAVAQQVGDVAQPGISAGFQQRGVEVGVSGRPVE